MDQSYTYPPLKSLKPPHSSLGGLPPWSDTGSPILGPYSSSTETNSRGREHRLGLRARAYQEPLCEQCAHKQRNRTKERDKFQNSPRSVDILAQHAQRMWFVLIAPSCKGWMVNDSSEAWGSRRRNERSITFVFCFFFSCFSSVQPLTEINGINLRLVLI